MEAGGGLSGRRVTWGWSRWARRRWRRVGWEHMPRGERPMPAGFLMARTWVTGEGGYAGYKFINYTVVLKNTNFLKPLLLRVKSKSHVIVITITT